MGSGRKVCVWFLANCEVQLCSTLAALSILGVVVVCPILLDPAIDTLVSSFEDGMCQTVYNQYLTGLSNCSWTSCREGCTADIYLCWHIIVVYMKGNQQEFDAYNNRANNGVEEKLNFDPTPPTHPPPPTTSIIPNNQTGANHTQSPKQLEEGRNTNHRRKWILPPTHNFHLYEYNNSFVRNIEANLDNMMAQIHQNLQVDNNLGGGNSLMNLTETKRVLGIGALLPNPQGCVYPISDIHCSDFREMYGRVGGDAYPCYLSRTNKTIVVTRVDTAGAMRNIFYSFLPLIAAAGIFTYLFYRVGLIGKKRRRRKVRDEESGGDESDVGTEQKSDPKGAAAAAVAMANGGAPPVVQKKMVKKFLPKKDSSKKRRKGKIFNKNKLLTLKSQLSVKSPSSSRRTPSIPMEGGGGSDDNVPSTTTAFVNNRTSVQLS
jgi:hypothetical protein